MNLQERIDKILSIGERIKDVKLLTSEEINLIVDAYFLYKGKKIQRINCGACLIDAYFEFRSLTQIQIKTFMERKYRMNKGVLLDTYMSSNPEIPQGHWSDANITDDVAVKLIKGGYGKYFIGNPSSDDIEEEEEFLDPNDDPEGNEGEGKEGSETTEGKEEASKQEEAKAPVEPERPMSAMTKAELQTLAKVKNLPEDEWKTLGRDKLEAYLISKA